MDNIQGIVEDILSLHLRIFQKFISAGISHLKINYIYHGWIVSRLSTSPTLL